MFNLMPAMFIALSSDGVLAAKECASNAARDTVIEGSGIERNLKLARFRHDLD